MRKVKVVCYSRVSGFYTPVNQWNKGKKQEFKDRQYYKLNGVLDEKNNKELP